jgi:hypothetical protein
MTAAPGCEPRDFDKMPDPAPSPKRRPTLAQLAQVAELLASFAVVVSLVFLVAEVRRNTEVTRAAAYDRSVDALNQWRLTIASDRDLATLWQAYRTDRQQFESDPQIQVLLNILWGLYENAYYSNRYRLLGASEWSRFQRQICTFYKADPDRWSRPFQERGLQPIRNLLTEEFATYVESSC